MKTVCMYSDQLYLVGGVESVVRDLYALLPKSGIRVVAVSEVGKPDWIAESDYQVLSVDPEARRQLWKAWLERHHPDCVVFNYVSRQFVDMVKEDIRLIRSLGYRCAHLVHSAFPTPMLLAEDELFYREVSAVADECDAVFTVSGVDAKWWTALGHKALKIQNPIRLPHKEPVPKKGEGPVELLWVGRPMSPKRPELAVEAFARARSLGADIRLTMVGGRQKGWRPSQRLAKKLKVDDRIDFLEARSDISDLWNRADIHLLTSVTESFCLVLAEAKAMGIPTVMFSIPYLELTASHKGLVEVEQEDVEAMAREIVRLAADRDLRSRLGAEASASLAGFDDATVVADWNRALTALATGEGYVSVDDDFRAVVRHCVFGWNRFCDANLKVVAGNRDWRKLSGGLLGFGLLSSVARFGVSLARKIKAVLRSVGK